MKKNKRSKKINLVVFDFDGTLSAYDSNYKFGMYCFRHSIRPWVFLPVVLIASLVSVINHKGTWWRQAMRCFLTKDMVKKLSPGFIKQHKMERYGWAADQVMAEKDAGNVVILISAGANYMVPKLVADIDFDAVITSQFETRRPWRMKFFCWNENKVVALNKWAAKNNYDYKMVRSYSDNKSDLPIMNLADEQVWIHPKTGARLTKPL